MVTRLSGGLSPADGSDPRTFPQIWNVTAQEIEDLQSDAVLYSGTAVPADGNVLTYSSAIPGWTAGTVSGGGGATAGGGAIYVNSGTVTESYTFEDGFNGLSAGPITIATGATVTVGTASAWSIV